MKQKAEIKIRDIRAISRETQKFAERQQTLAYDLFMYCDTIDEWADYLGGDTNANENN